MPEWFVSSLMMDRALDAIVRRAKTLDGKHDIPLSRRLQQGRQDHLYRPSHAVVVPL
jgi:hypothetical protein